MPNSSDLGAYSRSWINWEHPNLYCITNICCNCVDSFSQYIVHLLGWNRALLVSNSLVIGALHPRSMMFTVWKLTVAISPIPYRCRSGIVLTRIVPYGLLAGYCFRHGSCHLKLFCSPYATTSTSFVRPPVHVCICRKQRKTSHLWIKATTESCVKDDWRQY